MKPDEELRANYIARVRGNMSHADLLTELQNATVANRYGSKDDEISILRDEALRRMIRP